MVVRVEGETRGSHFGYCSDDGFTENTSNHSKIQFNLSENSRNWVRSFLTGYFGHATTKKCAPY